MTAADVRVKRHAFAAFACHAWHEGSPGQYPQKRAQPMDMDPDIDRELARLDESRKPAAKGNYPARASPKAWW